MAAVRIPFLRGYSPGRQLPRYSARMTRTATDPSWFTRSRLGLFVHWGIYSLAARHEWVKTRERITEADYQPYFDHFDPDLYDPRQWARDAKAAGMEYAVITTKHHDGFCLFETDLTHYKAPNTPAGRDLIRPFVEACRAEGMKIGFYYSLIDWHHPDYTIDGHHPLRDDMEARALDHERDMSRYRDYLHGQVRELMTNYGQIDVLWLDFSYSWRDWGWSKGKGKDDWDAERLLDMVRDLHPNILVNNRSEVPQDFHTPEQYQPRAWMHVDGKPVMWEACQTLNGSWGYDRDNLDWKSPGLLIRMLVDGVSKGGNLLLNVGPTARGEFDPRARATLASIGSWMHHHSRSIRGCTQAPEEFVTPPDCRYTWNPETGRLYVHLFAWPFRHLFLDGLGDRVAYAQFLHDGSEVRRTEYEDAGHFPTARADAAVLALPIQPPAGVEVPVIEVFLHPE